VLWPDNYQDSPLEDAKLRIRMGRPIKHKLCIYPDCGRKHNSKGYCSGHRAMQLKGEDLVPIKDRATLYMPATGLCLIDGCDRKVRSKGYCNAHYNRIVWRGLDPNLGQRSSKYPEICSDVDCSAKSMVKGLCLKHYQLQRYKANPRKHIIRYCTVEGCQEHHVAKGFCGYHYNVNRYIPKQKIPKVLKPKKICDVDDCDNVVKYRQWCGMHYSRWLRHGDPLVNYANKNKRTSYMINKSPIIFTNSYEEGMIMREYFEEMTGKENFLERYE